MRARVFLPASLSVLEHRTRFLEQNRKEGETTRQIHNSGSTAGAKLKFDQFVLIQVVDAAITLDGEHTTGKTLLFGPNRPRQRGWEIRHRETDRN